MLRRGGVVAAVCCCLLQVCVTQTLWLQRMRRTRAVGVEINHFALSARCKIPWTSKRSSRALA